MTSLPPLPDGAVLLHVGPFKTGTSAIQGALFRARPQLEQYGVLHAGVGTQPMQAVLALRGVPPLVGDSPPQIEQWHALVEQVTDAADRRVVVSSEFFGDVDEDVARRAVRELGGSRVHVVVTLRPLTRIMPSQWQQYVRNQATFSYGDWLDGMLRKPPYDKPTPSFWRRHHHDVVVQLWASVVGASNVTVVVPDETDRADLLRVFERLLGLPTGLLVADPSAENRSLTLGEVELVRQVNIEFRRRGWPDQLYKRLVRHGLIPAMQTGRVPAAGEPRITTPQWALDRAAEIGAAAAERVASTGVRVLGDLSSLGAHVVAGAGDGTPADSVLAVAAAREAVLGIVTASGALAPDALVGSTRATDLLRVVASRAGRRLRRVARRDGAGAARPPGDRG
jgi:hypothetical protein